MNIYSKIYIGIACFYLFLMSSLTISLAANTQSINTDHIIIMAGIWLAFALPTMFVVFLVGISEYIDGEQRSKNRRINNV